MIGAGGGVQEATRARVCCAWGKFQELSAILTSISEKGNCAMHVSFE